MNKPEQRNQAVRDVLAREVVMVCPHQATTGRTFMCALHPAAGLLCQGCATRHVSRAAHDLPCDGCGVERVPVLHGEVDPIPVEQVLVRRASGEAFVFGGMVFPFGVVRYCVPCCYSLASPEPEPAA